MKTHFHDSKRISRAEAMNLLWLLIAVLPWAASLGSVPSFAASKTLLSRELNVGARSYHLSVESTPSKPRSRGAGACGPGEEVALKIVEKGSRSPAWKKLIESCIENIELQGGALGSEDESTLLKALTLKEGEIEIRWVGCKVGRVSLKGRRIRYSE